MGSLQQWDQRIVFLRRNLNHWDINNLFDRRSNLPFFPYYKILPWLTSPPMLRPRDLQRSYRTLTQTIADHRRGGTRAQHPLIATCIKNKHRGLHAHFRKENRQRAPSLLIVSQWSNDDNLREEKWRLIALAGRAPRQPNNHDLFVLRRKITSLISSTPSQRNSSWNIKITHSLTLPEHSDHENLTRSTNKMEPPTTTSLNRLIAWDVSSKEGYLRKPKWKALQILKWNNTTQERDKCVK